MEWNPRCGPWLPREEKRPAGVVFSLWDSAGSRRDAQRGGHKRAAVPVLVHNGGALVMLSRVQA